MLVSTSAPPIPHWSLMLDDGVPIWDPDLGIIDQILDDDVFLDVLRRCFTRTCGASARRGRPSMPLNRLLRVGALKHVKNWSFRDLFKEMQRNLDYRAFTQFFGDTTHSSVATLARNIARIDAQALREMNEHLCAVALQRGIIKGRRYRQDTTVCETNVHYPTDSSLLSDGVRVLQRLTCAAVQLLPAAGPLRDRSRSVHRLAIDIARSARSRSEAAKARRETSYRKLLRIVRPVVTTATVVATKLGDRRATRHLALLDQLAAEALKSELDTMIPRVDGVIRQTRVRVCQGVTTYPDKLLSLFEPLTFVIRKGKLHKPNEFGRVVDIIEVENGFISDYRSLDGNPSDGDLLIPGIERHKQRFGRPPYTVATDAGFWSAKNEQDAYNAGVKRVSIPYKGKLSATRKRIQRSRWFRRAQRWRANGEGRIGILKNCFGLDRCMYKGDHAMERWLGWTIFANNLFVLARAIHKQQCHDETTATAPRKDARKVA